MRSHLASDLQDSSGDLDNAGINFVQTAFGFSSVFGPYSAYGGTPTSSTPPPRPWPQSFRTNPLKPWRP